jgi:S1-C subfamily serine protease
VLLHTVERVINKSAREGFQHGIGSGVIVSSKGLIMTAAHVVNLSDALLVKLNDGRRYTAHVKSTAPMADVALVQMDSPPPDLPVADLGNSDQTRIGEMVFVLGAPYGADHTLTVGYISAKRSTQALSNAFLPVNLIQTDAAINQGNSGGPLFNLKGQVVGIVSHIMSRSGGFEGLGFTVAINTAKELLLEKPSFWMGWEVILLTGDLAKALNLPQESGLLVQRVAENSLAKDMGLKGGTLPVILGDQKLLLGGDIVLCVQERNICTDPTKMISLNNAIESLPPQSPIKFTVLREGKIINLTLRK